MYVSPNLAEYSDECRKYAPQEAIEEDFKTKFEQNIHFAQWAFDMLAHSYRTIHIRMSDRIS